MARILLHTRQTHDQAGREIELQYFLISQPGDGMELYGAEIEMRREEAHESAQCLRVTPIASRMTELIDLLAEHTVTPATLREQLSELL